MAHPISLANTVDKMATKASATLNWDVVVNYSVPAINGLLAETFKSESTKQIKDIEFDIAVPNPFKHGETVPIHYKFGLAAPLLSFNPRGTEGPTCDLSFPIVWGTVAVKGGDTDTVPSGLYTLVFGALNLRTASGTAVTDPKSDDQSYVFHDSKEGYVVIDLPTSKSLTVNISIDEASKATHVTNIDSYIPFITVSIQKLLHNHGKYQDIRYEIARVNSHTPPPDMMQLKPKSFRFDAFLPSDTAKPGDIGVLSIFIQTRDTNHGTQNDLSTAWEAQWRTSLLCSPIPEGETSSIILNKSMVYESVIKPALEAAKFSGKGLSDTTGSLQLQIDTGKRVHRDKFYYKVPGSDALGYEWYKADPIDVTLPPLTLTLKENSGSPTYTTSWEWQYSCKWQYDDAGPTGIAGSVQDHITDGTTTAIHKVPKDADTHPKVTTLLDDYSLKMDCSISKSDWSVTFKPEDRGGWDRFWRGPDTVPKWMEGLDVEVADFNLHLGSVDFFLTTNLLFPGDKQVIDVDKKTGLHIPADLYIVGTVKMK
ncbi:hypothetical protein F5I97DRAFT_1414257 [Phlebopus sp. FC_14]|nr:hypothetical protein F5I97DRAFT_1414257 [Phlebopus sp. FC_14]